MHFGPVFAIQAILGAPRARSLSWLLRSRPFRQGTTSYCSSARRLISSNQTVLRAQEPRESFLSLHHSLNGLPSFSIAVLGPLARKCPCFATLPRRILLANSCHHPTPWQACFLDSVSLNFNYGSIAPAQLSKWIEHSLPSPCSQDANMFNGRAN